MVVFVEISVNNNVGSYVIVTLPGEIHSGNAGAVQSEINNVVSESNKVIFDFTANEFVSTAGIRVFLETLNKVQNANGKMAMYGMNELVFEVFDITGFVDVFGIVPTIEEAADLIR